MPRMDGAFGLVNWLRENTIPTQDWRECYMCKRVRCSVLVFLVLVRLSKPAKWSISPNQMIGVRI